MRKLLTSLLCLGLLSTSFVEAWAQEPPPAYPAPPVHTAPVGRGYAPVMTRPRRQTTRVTRPNAVYVELLGKGLFYSVGYDHAIFKWLALGGSFSYFKLGDAPTAFINPYALFYPAGGIHNSLMMQLGANFIYFGQNVDQFLPVWEEDGGFEFCGNFGIGYEYRGAFLFRVLGMAYFSEDGIIPWIGLTFGGAF